MHSIRKRFIRDVLRVGRVEIAKMGGTVECRHGCGIEEKRLGGLSVGVGLASRRRLHDRGDFVVGEAEWRLLRGLVVVGLVARIGPRGIGTPL